MKKQSLQLLTLICSGLVSASVSAGVAYPDPPGGWKYIYNGDKDTVGEPNSGFTSLDGTWSHDNGSDEFDGSKIGGALVADAFGVGNAPGGAMTLTEGGVTFLRMQDPGNPTQYDFPNPSNRKIFFGHNITEDGATDTVLDEGVAITFRARIPTPKKTTGPLDSLYRAGQASAGVKPYPDTGDGYLVSDGGKGNITIKQAAGGAIAFAFTLTDDTFGGNPADPKPNFAGLTMNEFNGNQITGNVDYREGSAFRGVPFDPTDWHEVWIVLRKDPGNVGTHQAFIFVDGSKEPTVLSLTAGDGSDFSGSYIAIGGSRTDENWALDVDFIAFKSGLVFPPGALDKPFVGGFAGTPSGFRLDLADGIAVGATKVNSASVAVTFDGQTVTATVSKKDDITTVSYSSPTILAPSSAHTVKVSFADTGTPPTTQTIEQKFTVENYAIITANTALDETKLDRT
ncbi:MAG: hypothetical protein HYY23_06315, partial [Verrucomicrobia bacterium]|nr:hypothetical protein [Verrucomicrobiota bacterium]